MSAAVFIALTLVFACIGAVIGHLRGRPVLGFFLGAALNVVGWCVSALLPRPQ